MNTFITFRLIFFASMIALILGPLGFWAARRMKLVDVPGSEPHKRHGGAVPLAGGLVLFVAVAVMSLIEGSFFRPSVRPILLASGIVFLFGLADDFVCLKPIWKLVGQIAGAVCLILLGVQVRLFHQEWLNLTLTLVWVVGVTNAYNFIDSMDGLAAGLAAMASAFFMLVTIDSQQGELSLFSTLVLGACLGSFYFNAAPAYFFLGDSGSQFLGFLLAALGIAYNPLGFSRLASWFVPILLVGIPIFDTTLVVLSRMRRGRPMYQGGLDHTFHRLVALGMSSNRAVLTMHMIALLLGCLAFIALDLPPLAANSIFAVILLAGAISLAFLDRQRLNPS